MEHTTPTRDELDPRPCRADVAVAKECVLVFVRREEDHGNQPSFPGLVRYTYEHVGLGLPSRDRLDDPVETRIHHAKMEVAAAEAVLHLLAAGTLVPTSDVRHTVRVVIPWATGRDRGAHRYDELTTVVPRDFRFSARDREAPDSELLFDPDLYLRHIGV